MLYEDGRSYIKMFESKKVYANIMQMAQIRYR